MRSTRAAIAPQNEPKCHISPLSNLTRPSPSAETTAAPTTSMKFDGNAVVPGNSVRVMAAGLSCPLCAHNIDTSMKQLPGVMNARADLNSGAIAVTLDGLTPVTYGQLAKIVRDNGFTLVGFDPAQAATSVEGGR